MDVGGETLLEREKGGLLAIGASMSTRSACEDEEKDAMLAVDDFLNVRRGGVLARLLSCISRSALARAGHGDWGKGPNIFAIIDVQLGWSANVSLRYPGLPMIDLPSERGVVVGSGY